MTDLTRPSDRPADDLLAAIVEGQHDALHLARSRGMDLDALAQWSERSDAVRTMTRLAQLADAQAQLQQSRCRLLAVSHLVSLLERRSNDDKERELVRKVSVDLLRVSLPTGAQAAASDDDPAALLEALLEDESNPGDDDANHA